MSVLSTCPLCTSKSGGACPASATSEVRHAAAARKAAPSTLQIWGHALARHFYESGAWVALAVWLSENTAISAALCADFLAEHFGDCEAVQHHSRQPFCQ